MAILSTLGPLLLALLLGYWWNTRLLTAARIDLGLKWLTNIILALIGYSIGSLENLQDKLVTAGTSAAVLLALIFTLNIGALFLSGHYLNPNQADENSDTSPTRAKLSWGIFADSIQTVSWVVVGGHLCARNTFWWGNQAYW